MKKNKGFLLFEVVISIVIITTGILFVMRGYLASKDSLQKSQELLKAALFLESGMWEFEEAGQIEEKEDGGDFSYDKNFAWKVNAEILEETEISLVTFEVFSKKDPENTIESIQTYLKNKTE